MKKSGLVVLVVMALSFGIVISNCSKEHSKKDKNSVALIDLPKVVMDTASNAVKGIKLTQAEAEKDDGIVVYELTGILGDKVYEIKVQEDGTLVKTKLKNADDKKEMEKNDPEKKIKK